MHLILNYQSGRRAEGVLLAVSAGRMRVVLQRQNDTVELRNFDGHWIADDDEPVEIESLVSDGCVEIESLLSQLAPRTHSARN